MSEPAFLSRIRDALADLDMAYIKESEREAQGLPRHDLRLGRVRRAG